jgi:hypothetical protein
MTVPEVSSDRFSQAVTRILRVLLFAGIALTPVFVNPQGRDLFRTPKTTLFQTFILAAGALAAAAALLSDGFAASLARSRRAVILACAGVIWVAIVTMTSTLPAVSHSAPFSIFCHALLFVIAIALLRSGSTPLALGAMFLPAIVNSITLVLQSLDL